MSAKDLNHTVRHIIRVVDIFFLITSNVFHGYCLFNMSDQLFVRIVFSCIWLKNYKSIVLRYSMTFKQYFCGKESFKKEKMVSMLECRATVSAWLWDTTNFLRKLTDNLCFQVFFGFVYPNHGVWGQATAQNFWHRSLSLKIKEYESILTNSLL